MKYSKVFLTIYRALTPVHVGSGTSLSYVDLPIYREKHTDFPAVPSSSVKGIMRSEFFYYLNQSKDKSQDEQDNLLRNIFGSEPEDTNFTMGNVIFTDLKLLLFPVRSLNVPYVWVSSPFLLKRFYDEYCVFFRKFYDNMNLGFTTDNNDQKAYIFGSSLDDQNLYLDEFKLEISRMGEIPSWLSQLLPKEIFAIRSPIALLSDKTATYLIRQGLETRTRIAIDPKTGVVKEGALFVEEVVPAETIFYGYMLFRDSKNSTIDEFKSFLSETQVIQIGGDETIGHGICRLHLIENG